MAKNDGTLMCRGATNDFGELGKGDRVEPVSEHKSYPVWYHEYPSSFVAKQRLRAGAAEYVVLGDGYVPWHWGSLALSAANGVERPTP